MRGVLIVAIVSGVAGLIGATPLEASTITFGTPQSFSFCNTSGDVGDRSCTHSASVSNGPSGSSATATVRGQASADSLFSSSDDEADLTVHYQIPYTVTRTITFELQGPHIVASVPVPRVDFVLAWSGRVAKDNTAASDGSATAFNALFQSLGEGTGATLHGAAQSGDGADSTTLNRTDFAGFDWEAAFPLGADHEPGTSATETLSDTLDVEFRLRASSPGGAFVNGGEVMACFGEDSTLSSFDINGSCGSGFTIDADVHEVRSEEIVVGVPEPTIPSLVLLACAFGAVRRRT